MEKFFSQKRVLVYIIIALVVFNIATVASFFMLNDGEHRGHQGNRDKMMNRGDFIKEKLALQNNQIQEYQIYHDNFWKKGKVLIDSLQSIRESMIKQMSLPTPDTIKIADLNVKFGLIHTELKKNAVDFYFKLRKICTPAQQDTLKAIFAKMMEFEGGRRPFRNHEHRGSKEKN